MLTILSPKDVEDGKDLEADKLQGRLMRLAAEETRLNKSINILREQEVMVMERIDEKVAKEEADFKERKAAYESEVSELERRKSIALEPLKPIIEAAERQKKENEERSTDISKRENACAMLEAQLDRQQDALIDQIDEFEDEKSRKIAELGRRETAVQVSEGENRRQAQSISVKWAEFHETAARANQNMEVRERVVRDGEKANEIIKASLVERENKVYKRETMVNDKYNTLLEATKEFERKQHGNN